MFLESKLDEIKKYIRSEYQRGHYDSVIGNEHLADFINGEVLVMGDTKTLAFMAAQLPEDCKQLRNLDPYLKYAIKDYLTDEIESLIDELREEETKYLMARRMEYRYDNSRSQSP